MVRSDSKLNGLPGAGPTRCAHLITSPLPPASPGPASPPLPAGRGRLITLGSSRRADRRNRHADTTSGARNPSAFHIWCSTQLVPLAHKQARGGKREPGESPGLPRSGERERQPSESCAQARGGNSTGPDQPGKRRPVGSVNGDAAPVSPKTCQRAARDHARGGSGRAGRPTSTAPGQKAGGRLRRVLA